jgi:hypothetical protein
MSEWIKLTDKPPENNSIVLAVHIDGFFSPPQWEQATVDVHHGDDGKIRLYPLKTCAPALDIETAHWMPLPDDDDPRWISDRQPDKEVKEEEEVLIHLGSRKKIYVFNTWWRSQSYSMTCFLPYHVMIDKWMPLPKSPKES